MDRIAVKMRLIKSKSEKEIDQKLTELDLAVMRPSRLPIFQGPLGQK